ncbi:MAG: diaminopimelate epimerase [candidate division Zixibacteria bacterium]|nr:diaminopimelate epimerase [candidate division Zixibacteria bacterium]
MPTIHFAKYQAIENDFCVIGPASPGFNWTHRRAAEICHRRRGVGSDGLIILGKPSAKGVPFRLFNADGSRAEWSGNGVRCAAAHLAGQKRRAQLRLLTAVGSIESIVITKGSGRFLASFERPMPIVGDPISAGRKSSPARLAGPIPVDAGNPHWIYVVADFDIPWEELGARAQSLNRPTHGVNVEFVRVLNRHQVELRIFERGVGPTPSSGSGALAAVAACWTRGLVDSRVRIISPGGEQKAEISKDHNTVRLSAMTHHVCSGDWKIS